MTRYAMDACDLTAVRDALCGLLSGPGGETRWLALIDTAFDHGTSPLRWNERVWPVYCQGRLERLAKVSPVLLALDVENPQRLNRALSRLLHHCQGRPMLSFLQTRLTPEQLVETWQTVLELQPDEGQPLLLRFADTRPLPDIAQLLADTAWRGLSAYVTQWHYLDRSSRLQHLETASSADAAAPADGLVRVDDETLFEFMRRSLPDALANALQENFPDLFTMDGAATYQRLAAVCALAEKNGIEAFPDIIALAVAAYSTGDELREADPLSTWLSNHDWKTGEFVESLTAYVEARDPRSN